MRYLLSVLLLGSLACAQTPAKPKPPAEPSLFTDTASGITLTSGPQPMIAIGGNQIIEMHDKDGKLIIRIDRDGKSTLGDDYHPDAGAKAFWEAMAKYYPLVCIPPKPATMPAKEGQPK